jgi:SAM-dependent methyltransferase
MWPPWAVAVIPPKRNRKQQRECDKVRALVQRFYEGPLLQKLGGRLDHARVLDVGCGRGVEVQILLEQFGAGQVYGIDLDPQQVRRAQKRFAGTAVHFLAGLCHRKRSPLCDDVEVALDLEKPVKH